jgi:hypothetical protein
VLSKARKREDITVADNCNCIEHFNSGYKAGCEATEKKYCEPEVRLTEEQIYLRYEGDESFRFEGHYAVTIYLPSSRDMLSNWLSWKNIIQVLEQKCGTVIETLKFELNVESLEDSDCQIGLREC